jgi:octaprenyl-diphosphate synthase
MSKLDDIKKPVENELKEFEPFFRDAVKSKISLLDVVTKYIIKRKGKQMRPMFVFLSAKMLGEVNQSSYRAAALIELMHTATLIHDDVVDDSHMRRGVFSINALWKNKIAVLVGDFLLSKGMLIALENKEYELLEIVSKAVREMSEGELMQIEKARKLDIKEDVYFEIIRKKTAVLIASCMATGGKSAGLDNEQVSKLWQIGELAGIAFQIKDDLFDYQKTNLTGKPTGNDIKERKLTLPLIYALNQSSKPEQKHILSLLKKKKKTDKIISEISNFAKQKGGLEYTEKTMLEYKEKSLQLLDEFSDNEAKTSLQELINYSVTRKK